MPETKDNVSRDALKVHFELFKHLTTLSVAVSVVLLAVGGRFKEVLGVSVFGVAALALTVLVGVVGMWAVSLSVRKPSPSNLAFLVSEILVFIACLSFISSMLAVLDNFLRPEGLSFYGWLWWVFRG